MPVRAAPQSPNLWLVPSRAVALMVSGSTRMIATGLPEDVKLPLLYAGQGTLWTDMNHSASGDFGVRATIPLQAGDSQK